MIVFIIPVKSKKVATSWLALCQLFERSLRDDSSRETMLEDYQADIDRYVITQGGSWIYHLLTKQGLWALAEYRFSRWVRTEVQIPIIKQILKTLGFIWHKIIEIIAGIDIPSKTQIGKGFYIGHFGGIIINQDVKIGENCNISQGVTIGVGGRGEKSGCPVIGDRVFIGPGAKIFGKIRIGNDVAIGANAVVTKDLPDNAVAVGIPAKIISYEGSQDLVILGADNGMKKEISSEN